MTSTYISKETGRVVQVHRISNGCHWYMLPEYSTEQCTRSDIFLNAMTKKEGEGMNKLYAVEVYVNNAPSEWHVSFKRFGQPSFAVTDTEEQAELIATAMNSHQAMKEALTGLTEHAAYCLEQYGFPLDDSMLMLALIDQANRALTLTKGGQGDNPTKDLINQVRHLHD